MYGCESISASVCSAGRMDAFGARAVFVVGFASGMLLLKRFNGDDFAGLQPFAPALLYPMAGSGSRLTLARARQSSRARQQFRERQRHLPAMHGGAILAAHCALLSHSRTFSMV